MNRIAGLLADLAEDALRPGDCFVVPGNEISYLAIRLTTGGSFFPALDYFDVAGSAFRPPQPADRAI